MGITCTFTHMCSGDHVCVRVRVCICVFVSMCASVEVVTTNLDPTLAEVQTVLLKPFCCANLSHVNGAASARAEKPKKQKTKTNTFSFNIQPLNPLYYAFRSTCCLPAATSSKWDGRGHVFPTWGRGKSCSVCSNGRERGLHMVNIPKEQLSLTHRHDNAQSIIPSMDFTLETVLVKLNTDQGHPQDLR